MSEYLDPEAARDLPGLRLVLTTGVPGPWGEAAKSIFYVKKIDYARVRQDGGMANEALEAWTGQTNAPQAVFDDEPARSGWTEILLLAERLAPEPRLIPSDPRDRVLCFGLCHEICGEEGLGWMRRLQLLHPMMSLPDAATNPALAVARRLSGRYGYSSESADAADERVAEILGLFRDQLASQRAAGSDYLVGSSLSAVDIYWATFAAMLKPLPAEVCPMSDVMRGAYGSISPRTEAALDEALLEHRDRIYERHLELPLDF
jgi:glutathione S-transferase